MRKLIKKIDKNRGCDTYVFSKLKADMVKPLIALTIPKKRVENPERILPVITFFNLGRNYINYLYII